MAGGFPAGLPKPDVELALGELAWFELASQPAGQENRLSTTSSQLNLASSEVRFLRHLVLSATGGSHGQAFALNAADLGTFRDLRLVAQHSALQLETTSVDFGGDKVLMVSRAVLGLLAHASSLTARRQLQAAANPLVTSAGAATLRAARYLKLDSAALEADAYPSDLRRAVLEAGTHSLLLSAGDLAFWKTFTLEAAAGRLVFSPHPAVMSKDWVLKAGSMPLNAQSVAALLKHGKRISVNSLPLAINHTAALIKAGRMLRARSADLLLESWEVKALVLRLLLAQASNAELESADLDFAFARVIKGQEFALNLGKFDSWFRRSHLKPGFHSIDRVAELRVAIRQAEDNSAIRQIDPTSTIRPQELRTTVLELP